MKPHVLLTSPPFESTRQALDESFTCHLLSAAADRAEFLAKIGPKIRGLATFNAADAALIEALPALEIIANCSVGNDGIDLEAAARKHIVVTNTPDVLNACVAETALALTLNLVHQYPQAEQWLRSGAWSERGPFRLTVGLQGKTMGILGLGRIGTAIAERALACGMHIRYHNRNRRPVAYEYDPDPIALARNSDILMIATPGGSGTQALVEGEVLAALGQEGYLVNIARGSVVDEPALIAALREKRIAGAALDVFCNEPHIDAEFLHLENVVLTPHVGSATFETRQAMGELQVENLRKYFAGQPVLTRVV